MSELILWKKQELDKLRKDMDLLFRRFRRGFGVPRTLLEAADSFATGLSETEKVEPFIFLLPLMVLAEVEKGF